MSLPLWISNLQDPVLRADFTAFYSKGTITEAEMTKALTDLAAEIGPKGTVSASQIADLQIIAGSIVSMGASNYLLGITDNLVDGDAANQFFTDGLASSVPLGDLVAGSSSLVLGELTDKWFLGTDLPNYSATTGAPAYNISYAATDAPLYDSAAGPEMSDVNQGLNSGDCYFLAPLAEIAQQDPAMIESMITPNGNGSDGVRFYSAEGIAIYVTVADDLLPTSSTPGLFNNYSVGDWVNILEVAFAQAQEQGLLTGNTAVDVWNSFTTIDSGGLGYVTLEAVTGARDIQGFVGDPSASDWSEVDVHNTLHGLGSSTTTATEASVLPTVAADLLVGDVVEVGSKTDDSVNGVYSLIADHAFSVYGYEATTGELELRNPMGVQAGQTWDGQPWDTTFEVSLNTLFQDSDSVFVADTGTATSVSGASVVAAAGLQAMSQITSFSVTDTAYHVSVGVGSGSGPLTLDTKLTSVTANGTSGGDVLILTGFKDQAYVAMDGNSDSASVSGFVPAPSPALPGQAIASGIDYYSGYDYIALGSGRATIDNWFGSGAGVELVDNFNSALDVLSIALNGGSLEQTFIGGSDWISSSSDLTHGVLLRGVSSVQHATISGGIATVA